MKNKNTIRFIYWCFSPGFSAEAELCAPGVFTLISFYFPNDSYPQHILPLEHL